MKTVAASMAAVLFFGLSTESWAQSNIWDERRAARPAQPASPAPALLAHLPAATPAGFMSVSPLAQFSSRVASDAPSFLSPLLPLLSVHGVVRSVQTPKNAKGPAVIFIQDVHTELSAQKNMASIILNVLDRHPDAWVGLEGGAGVIDAIRWRGPSVHVNREVGSFFLNAGLINGPEYVAFAAVQAPRLAGVEDKDLYLKNVEAVVSASAARATWLARLKEWESDLSRRKFTVYSPALKEFDDKLAARAAGTLSLTDYVSYLTAQPGGAPAQGSALGIFMQTLALEKSLDFTRVESERKEVLTCLVSALKKPALEELTQRSLAFRQGQLSYPDFYAALKRTADQVGVKLSSYPQFDKYVKYVVSTDAIVPESLWKEISAAETRVGNALCATPEQKEVLSLSSDLVLLNKLVRLTLTTDEWEDYESRRKSIAARVEREGPLSLDSFESFYQAAEARNHALVGNLLTRLRDGQTSTTPDKSGSQSVLCDLGTGTACNHKTPPVAILVAGGFHAPGVAQLLKDRGVTLVTVSPKFKMGSPEKNGEYMDVFTRQKTPLEKLFDSPEISLVRTLGIDPLTQEGRWREKTLHDLTEPALAAAAVVQDPKEGDLVAQNHHPVTKSVTRISAEVGMVRLAKGFMVVIGRRFAGKEPELPAAVGTTVSEGASDAGTRFRVLSERPQFGFRRPTAGMPWAYATLAGFILRSSLLALMPIFLLATAAFNRRGHRPPQENELIDVNQEMAPFIGENSDSFRAAMKKVKGSPALRDAVFPHVLQREMVARGIRIRFKRREQFRQSSSTFGFNFVDATWVEAYFPENEPNVWIRGKVAAEKSDEMLRAFQAAIDKVCDPLILPGTLQHALPRIWEEFLQSNSSTRGNYEASSKDVSHSEMVQALDQLKATGSAIYNDAKGYLNDPQRTLLAIHAISHLKFVMLKARTFRDILSREHGPHVDYQNTYQPSDSQPPEASRLKKGEVLVLFSVLMALVGAAFLPVAYLAVASWGAILGATKGLIPLFLAVGAGSSLIGSVIAVIRLYFKSQSSPGGLQGAAISRFIKRKKFEKVLVIKRDRFNNSKGRWHIRDGSIMRPVVVISPGIGANLFFLWKRLTQRLTGVAPIMLLPEDFSTDGALDEALTRQLAMLRPLPDVGPAIAQPAAASDAKTKALLLAGTHEGQLHVHALLLFTAIFFVAAGAGFVLHPDSTWAVKIFMGLPCLGVGALSFAVWAAFMFKTAFQINFSVPSQSGRPSEFHQFREAVKIVKADLKLESLQCVWDGISPIDGFCEISWNTDKGWQVREVLVMRPKLAGWLPHVFLDRIIKAFEQEHRERQFIVFTPREIMNQSLLVAKIKREISSSARTAPSREANPHGLHEGQISRRLSLDQIAVILAGGALVWLYDLSPWIALAAVAVMAAFAVTVTFVRAFVRTDLRRLGTHTPGLISQVLNRPDGHLALKFFEDLTRARGGPLHYSGHWQDWPDRDPFIYGPGFRVISAWQVNITGRLAFVLLLNTFQRFKDAMPDSENGKARYIVWLKWRTLVLKDMARAAAVRVKTAGTWRPIGAVEVFWENLTGLVWLIRHWFLAAAKERVEITWIVREDPAFVANEIEEAIQVMEAKKADMAEEAKSIALLRSLKDATEQPLQQNLLNGMDYMRRVRDTAADGPQPPALESWRARFVSRALGAQLAVARASGRSYPQEIEIANSFRLAGMLGLYFHECMGIVSPMLSLAGDAELLDDPYSQGFQTGKKILGSRSLHESALSELPTPAHRRVIRITELVESGDSSDAGQAILNELAERVEVWMTLGEGLREENRDVLFSEGRPLAEELGVGERLILKGRLLERLPAGRYSLEEWRKGVDSYLFGRHPVHVYFQKDPLVWVEKLRTELAMNVFRKNVPIALYTANLDVLWMEPDGDLSDVMVMLISKLDRPKSVLGAMLEVIKAARVYASHA